MVDCMQIKAEIQARSPGRPKSCRKPALTGRARRGQFECPSSSFAMRISSFDGSRASHSFHGLAIYRASAIVGSSRAGRRGCSFVADDLHEVGIAGDLTMKANMLREAGTGCKVLQWPAGKSLLVTGTGARLSRNGQ